MSRRPFVIFVLIATLLLGLRPHSTFAQTDNPAIDDGFYHDPDGRFSVPVPTNWTVEDTNGFPVLSDPDGDLQMAIVVVPGSDATDAVDDAWELFAPDVQRVSNPDVAVLPDEPDFDEVVVVTDDFGDPSGEIKQAIAIRVGGENYVIIATGSLDAAIQRNSQIQIILTGFTISSLAATPVANPELLPFEGALVDEFDAYAAELLERLKVPGASVAVIVDGKIVFASGYGVSDIASGQPVTADTYMMIGSTTKSMTTMMMASAIDDEVFAWDTPAVEVFPEFAMADPALTESVTMRNLVCACTGVPRQDLAFALNGDASAEDVVASLRTFEVYTDVGEAFQYSNQMVAAGGFIAAYADNDGAPMNNGYLNSMQNRVFDPIGMTRTTFEFADVESDPDHASPHGASLYDGYVPIPLSYEEVLLPIAPAGAAWSTANDMAAYLITQMQRGMAPNGTHVVSPENLTETWQPQVQVDATISYGLGWLLGDSFGQSIIFHDGNTFGFSAKVAFLPESQIGIVVLANAQGANLYTEGVVQRFFELINGEAPAFDETIDSQLEIQESQITTILRQVGDRPDAADVEDLIGLYESEDLGSVVLSIDDRGALMVDTGEFQMEARPVPDAPIRSLVLVDPPLVLNSLEVRETDSGMQLVIVEGIDERIFERVTVNGTPVASPVST